MSVFLHYTQAEFDRQYDQRAWAANATELVRRYGETSARVRERLASRNRSAMEHRRPRRSTIIVAGQTRHRCMCLSMAAPQRHLGRPGCGLIVAFAQFESTEFRPQSRDFAHAGESRARLIEGQGFNHFEIVETLGDPDGLLGHLALTQMGLST
jgi:hypothetical protein